MILVIYEERFFEDSFISQILLLSFMRGIQPLLWYNSFKLESLRLLKYIDELFFFETIKNSDLDAVLLAEPKKHVFFP